MDPFACGRVRRAGDPVATPELSSRTISTRGRWSPATALSVSPHSGADGLVQVELPPISPEFLPFSPALLVTLGALPGLGPVGFPWNFAGSPVPTTRRYSFFSSLPPACATPDKKGVCTHTSSGPSRVRRLFQTCLGVTIHLAIC